MSTCSSDSKILIVDIWFTKGEIVHLIVLYGWSIVIRTGNISEISPVSGHLYRINVLRVKY